MTKAILGVDPGGKYEPAARLLSRMNFPELEVFGISVVEPVVPDMSLSGFSIDHPAAVIMQEREECSKKALERAGKLFANASYHGEVTFGGSAVSLMHHAREVEADLLAVGSERKGRFGSLFMGSTTKGLTIEAQRSILIGKSDVHEDGGLHAVIATDLSKYMDQCLEKLIQLAPAGFTKMTLVNAFEVDDHARHFLEPDDPELGHLSPERMRREQENLCGIEGERLLDLGCEVEIAVHEGHPNEVINHVMADTKADLLIIGAQGKGFMERLVLGSTAMHFVISEGHNLLILRV